MRSQRLQAPNLNARFQIDLDADPSLDEDLCDIYCYENSQHRYFDVDDTETTFNQFDNNDFFFNVYKYTWSERHKEFYPLSYFG